MLERIQPSITPEKVENVIYSERFSTTLSHFVFWTTVLKHYQMVIALFRMKMGSTRTIQNHFRKKLLERTLTLHRD